MEEEVKTTQMNSRDFHAFVKNRVKEAVVLVKVGNFYETYGIDAVIMYHCTGQTLYTTEKDKCLHYFCGCTSSAVGQVAFDIASHNHDVKIVEACDNYCGYLVLEHITRELADKCMQ